VWEDHLLSRLTCQDAARLGCTCKSLRGVAREHFRDLGLIKLDKLQAALTTFPRARSVAPNCFDTGGWRDAEREALVEWLQGGGHGEAITTIRTTLGYDKVNDIVHAALRGGALPSLKGVSAHFYHESHQTILTEGFLRPMRDLSLFLRCNGNNPGAFVPQLAALGLVRQLPALARLELAVCPDDDVDHPVEWPPFILPSLKALRIVTEYGPMNQSLLRALPGMLRASGATLGRLEIRVPYRFQYLGDELVHLAQTLRCCSPTLRVLLLSTEDDKCLHADEGVEDTRARWSGCACSGRTCWRACRLAASSRCSGSRPFKPRHRSHPGLSSAASPHW
jgi:hypothetical protein